MDNHQGVFFNLKSSLESAHPDLPPGEIADILADLRRQKLINTQAYQINESTRFIKVSSDAYAYFERRGERDEEEAAAMAAVDRKIESQKHRAWNFRMILSGYVAGLVSGIILTGIFLILIKDTLFR